MTEDERRQTALQLAVAFDPAEETAEDVVRDARVFLKFLSSSEPNEEPAVVTPISPPRDIYFLSVLQAADALAIGRSKFYELIRDGSIKTVKVGRRTLIHIDELQRFADDLAICYG